MMGRGVDHDEGGLGGGGGGGHHYHYCFSTLGGLGTGLPCMFP